MSAADRADWRARLVVASVFLAEALLLLAPILHADGVPVPLNQHYASDRVFGDDLERLAQDPEFAALPVNLWAGDVALVFHPWYHVARESVLAGRLPLWTNAALGGYPIGANWQLAALDPLSLVGYPLLLRHGLLLRMALRLLVAATGAYALARAASGSRAAGIVAGTAFALSGPVVTWLASSVAAAAVWCPWVLAATIRLDRLGRFAKAEARDTAFLAITLALGYFAGGVETSFLIGMAAAAVVVTRVARSPAPRRVAPRLARFALAALLGALAAAVQVLPFEEGLRLCGEAERRTTATPLLVRLGRGLRGGDLAGAFGQDLASVAFPEIQGTPLAYDFPAPRKAPNLFEQNAYVGLLPLALAGAGVLRAGSGGRFAVLGGLAALGIALGWPVAHLVNVLPFLEVVLTGRLRLVWAAALALAAGLGLDALTRQNDAEARRWLKWVTLGALLLALHAGLVLTTLHVRGYPHASTPRIALALAALAVLPVAAACLARLRRRVGPVTALALTLVAGDLLAHGLFFNTYVLPRHADVEPGAVRFVRAQPGRGRVASAAPDVLLANYPMVWELEQVEGYEFVRPAWLGALAERARAEPGGVLDDLRGVRWIFDVAESDLGARRPHLRLVHRDRGVTVWESASVFPRAWLARRARRVARDEDVLAAVAAASREELRAAVFTADPALPALTGEDGSPAGEAEVEALGDDRLAVRVRAPGPRYLVLAETYYPGWQAEVDGTPATIHRVDHAFRAVLVPAGEHRVTMRFAPWRTRVGLVISAATLVLLLAMVSAPTRRGRPAPAAASSPAPGA